jgi:hypothetical protein
VLELYAIADGRAAAGPGDPTVVLCMDEFGPLNLQPRPGRQWAPTTVGEGDLARPRRRRRRATYLRPNGIRHLLAGYDLATDRLYGHIKVRKTRVTCRNELRCTPADYPQPPWQCAYRRGLRELRRRLSVGKLAVWVRRRGGRARAVRSGCGRVVRERSLRTGARSVMLPAPGRLRPEAAAPGAVRRTSRLRTSHRSDTPERVTEVQQPVQQRAPNGGELRRTSADATRV